MIMRAHTIKYLLLCSFCLLSHAAFAAKISTELTLTQAIDMALRHDSWLQRSQYQQQALLAQSIAATTLPDPTISLALANVPTDNFSLGQEGMTQLKMGISQMLPRGNSRALQHQRLAWLSAQQPWQRADRQAKLTAMVTHAWLVAYQAQATIHLIEKDYSLFEHLVTLVQDNYAAGLAKARQHDVIRAQLTLTRLDDRLTRLREQQQIAKATLSEWLGDQFSVATSLPTLALLHPSQFSLAQHPALRSWDQKIHAAQTEVHLAEQQYQPQWMINASYAYRRADPMGRRRADFLSFGVGLDLPIFTDRRQDNTVAAKQAMMQANKVSKTLLLRQMTAAFAAKKSQLLRLNQRQSLYRTKLLTQMHAQAEATLTAYTNDDGDFAEVVRTRIAELNSKIDALVIDVERLQTIAQLNYFFVDQKEQA